MLTIKILGSGCANCKKLEAVTRQVITNMQLDAEIIKVTEYPEIMAYNIMSTPGLVVNDRVVSAGRIPSQSEITGFLSNATSGI